MKPPFYECAQKGEDHKMREAEFERFMLRLTKQQRKWFEEEGTFGF